MHKLETKTCLNFLIYAMMGLDPPKAPQAQSFYKDKKNFFFNLGVTIYETCYQEMLPRIFSIGQIQKRSVLYFRVKDLSHR